MLSGLPGFKAGMFLVIQHHLKVTRSLRWSFQSASDYSSSCSSWFKQWYFFLQARCFWMPRNWFIFKENLGIEPHHSHLTTQSSIFSFVCSRKATTCKITKMLLILLSLYSLDHCFSNFDTWQMGILLRCNYTVYFGVGPDAVFIARFGEMLLLLDCDHSE